MKKQTIYVHAYETEKGFRDCRWYWNAIDAEESYKLGAAWRLQRFRHLGSRLKNYLLTIEEPSYAAESEITAGLERNLKVLLASEETAITETKTEYRN
jgi:hypothetical protein